MRTRGAGTRDAVMEFGRQGPLASSPRLKVSPSPSCPLMFMPQHLTVVSFCGEQQPRITDRLRTSIDLYVRSFTQCNALRRPPT